MEAERISYAELQVSTNFSFLRGGSHPEEFVETAIELGYSALAISDWNTLAGIVRAYKVARNRDFKIIPACRLELADGPSLLAYPVNREAYGRLSALLSLGNLRAEKGECLLYKKDVYDHAEGILFVTVAPSALNSNFELEAGFIEAVEEYKAVLGPALHIGAVRTYQANDSKLLFRLNELAENLHIPLVALNDVYYHRAERRELQDILTCIREKCTIYDAGFRLQQNAERHLKSPAEMKRLFAHYPQALENAARIAEQCRFSLSELRYEYPEEITSEGRSPQEELIYLTWQGAEQRFGKDIPAVIKQQIDYELDFIQRKNYASYFLTVYDFVRFAREEGILCQGRGSAANSVVCFCLGITSVDPSKFKLLFSRFMSDARDEPPDIDVDFEHERREEVIQYIYRKYGRHRAAIVATVTRQHYKGAVRDVARAMGLSVDAVNNLAAAGWEFDEDWFEGKSMSSSGFDAADPHLRKVLELTRQYIGFPRQLGQHTGGFVITRGRLSDLCPVLNARMENRTCIEWDKDDIDTLGFLKVDVLALGMLTCIHKAFDLAREHYGLNLTLANIPQDDPAVYAMVSRADTIGVFQIESRAQMAMLPRLKPGNFYDLVIEVALVRPGPIQGDMVHPYLRRRNGEEPVEFPSEELREILGRTLGVPLFQEQAMEIAIVAAGFTPAEADELRRSMATFKSHGMVSRFEEKLVKGMVAKGYSEEFARRVFKQLEGFGSYGFPESHAASFALLVYVSSWLKCYYPDVFAAAMINSQPLGFYQPAQLITDARKHGVAVRPVDVNFSEWDCRLEEKVGHFRALRLGFRQVKSLRESDAQLLVALRQARPADVHGRRIVNIQLLAEAGLSQSSLELLADADAFRSIGLDRRKALWEVASLREVPGGLFAGQIQNTDDEKVIRLPEMPAGQHVLEDYRTLSLSLKAHPLSFVRRQLSLMGVTPTANLTQLKDGAFLRVAGLVLIRQRPGTASGICFVTIEDDTGTANLVIFRDLFDKCRREIVQSHLLMVEGKLQREGAVIHVISQRCYDVSGLLNTLQADSEPTLVQGDIFHGGRNFH